MKHVCPHPAFTTPQCDLALSRRGIETYLYTTHAPGRSPDKILDLSAYDLAPIRGVAPPPVDATTLIPFTRMHKVWRDLKNTNEWTPSYPHTFHIATFGQIVDLTRSMVLKSPEELCLFGVMLRGQTQHLLLDIDGKLVDWPHLAGRLDEVKAEVRSSFVAFYQHLYDKAPDMSRWLHEDSTNPVKVSLHRAT